MKTTLRLLILLFACSILACVNGEKLNDEDTIQTFLLQLQSVPSSFEDNDFPEWLSIKISEIETIHSRDLSIVKVKIYKGEWNERIVYLITDFLKSAPIEVYYENGDLLTMNSNSHVDFYTSSKNWKLIYEFGNGLY